MTSEKLILDLSNEMCARETANFNKIVLNRNKDPTNIKQLTEIYRSSVIHHEKMHIQFEATKKLYLSIYL